MNQTEIISLLEKKISISKKALTMPLTSSQTFRKGKWTQEEDSTLKYYVSLFGERNWKKVSEHMEGRSSIQCLHRWTKILKPGLVKGPWTYEEDMKLLEWVGKEGALKWSRASQLIPGRSGKQCRERWLNNLNPNIKKSNWNDEEDELIFALYKKYGSAWSKIAKHFEGRTENSIKNRFYSTIRRLALDRTRQTTSESGIEKIDKNKKSKEGSLGGNGELQSILQELTHNYKNSEKNNDEKIEFVVKKEDESKIIKNINFNSNDNNNIDEVNLMNGLINFEKNMIILQKEIENKEIIGDNCQKTDKNIGTDKLNELFHDILAEEEETDQKILYLIKQLKNFECSLMSKTKEFIVKDVIKDNEIIDESIKRKNSFNIIDPIRKLQKIN